MYWICCCWQIALTVELGASGLLHGTKWLKYTGFWNADDGTNKMSRNYCFCCSYCGHGGEVISLL